MEVRASGKAILLWDGGMGLQDGGWGVRRWVALLSELIGKIISISKWL